MKVSQKKEILPNNLPVPLSTFIGREREMGEVKHLIASHRLVTLTGAGGSGKTRLALEAARGALGEFRDGAWLIELASIFDPAFVPQALAAILNIREESGRSVMDMLVDTLSARHTLLLIDNCEHLITACAQLAETLLQKSPELKILATSREALGITGEVAWPVPPLSLPNQQPWTNPESAQDALGLYGASELVQLFVARAGEHSPDFKLTEENGAWVAEICRHLDGMPLAIELAAARVRSLSIQQISQRLDDRFRLLTGGSRTAPARHQTLASTIDWSYDILSEKEQKVLRRLSVFAAGATLEAAETVCSGNGIESSDVFDALSPLVDKSLVMATRAERGGTRFRLLETIRQYALEKLTGLGEADESRDRHLNYFIQWAENAEPFLNGAEQLQWLDLYEDEHDNLRAALEWSSTDLRNSAPGLRLAAACGRFWRLHGYLSEGRTHLSAALSQRTAQERTLTRARALTAIANLAYLQSDYRSMRLQTEDALSIWRELGAEGKSGAAFTLDLLGELATEEGDYARALPLFQEALEIYKEIQNLRGIGEIYMQFGWAAMRTGDYPKAQSYLEECLQLALQVEDKTGVAFAFSGLGEVAIRQERYDDAISLLEQGLTLNRERGNKWDTATLLGSLAWVALRQHDFERMKVLLNESLSIRKEISDKGGIAWCLEKLGEARCEQSQLEKAAKIFGHAESMRTAIGSVMDPVDQPNYNRLIFGLQSALGIDAFAAACAEGKSMRLDDVIGLALLDVDSGGESPLTEKERFGGLTAREREVAVLIARGKSNREIAEAMTVRAKTVETYITRMLNKLGFSSRVQIATWAIEKGLR